MWRRVRSREFLPSGVDDGVQVLTSESTAGVGHGEEENGLGIGNPPCLSELLPDWLQELPSGSRDEADEMVFRGLEEADELATRLKAKRAARRRGPCTRPSSSSIIASASRALFSNLASGFSGEFSRRA